MVFLPHTLEYLTGWHPQKKCLEAHFPGLNLALQAPHSLRDYQHFSAPHSGPAKAPFDEENVERRWDFGGWPG